MKKSAAVELAARLSARGAHLVTAESCTAGLVSSSMAELSGASAYLWGAFVCYSNEAKIRLLGIDPDLLSKAGAVSKEVSLAMAEGALHKSGVDIAVSVTGLAGPEGDGSSVPVGTVWIATALTGMDSRATQYRYEGDRNAIREAAAQDALSDAALRLGESLQGSLDRE